MLLKGSHHRYIVTLTRSSEMLKTQIIRIKSIVPIQDLIDTCDCCVELPVLSQVVVH